MHQRWCPNPKQLIADCHEAGLKFLLWQVPIEKYLNGNKHPLKDRNEAYMIEKDYGVKKCWRQPISHIRMLVYRFNAPWFYQWGRKKNGGLNKRQYLIDIGVDCFKTDGGEKVLGGKNTRFCDGTTGLYMRNKYPNDYIKAYYDFAKQNDSITFSRAGC